MGPRDRNVLSRLEDPPRHVVGHVECLAEGEEPDFRHPASGRRFVVSTYGADGLVALLEGQIGVDIGLDFPGCQLKWAGSCGGWYAVYRDQADGGGDAVVWLVHAPAIAGVHAALRALSHQTACQRRRP